MPSPGQRPPAAAPRCASLPVLLLRAAHPRQALVTAARRWRVAAALAGRPAARGRPGPRHRAGRPGRSSAGTTTSSTGAATPRTSRRASRSPRGWLDPGRSWFALAVRPAARRAARRSPTASPPARLPGSRWPSACSATRPARQRALVACPGRSVRALPAFLVVRRLGRQGAGDAARAVAMTVLAALLGIGVHVLVALPGPGRRQPGRRAPPSAADRAAHRVPPGCWWSRRAHRLVVIAGLVVAAAPSA